MSSSAAAAALSATELATQLGARLLVASVIDARASASLFSARADEVRSRRERGAQDLVLRAQAAGAHAAFLIWQGDPGATIISAAEAEGADLIVIGTRGREGVARLLLGSVSDYVVRHAPCPVMVVHPPANGGPDGPSGPAHNGPVGTFEHPAAGLG
jgi:nucleotide-binding universal stress UspA family protein